VIFNFPVVICPETNKNLVMGNYSGKTNLLKVKVNTKNPKKGLVKIIESLDSDYEEYADQIVDNIMAENDDVIEMVDAVIGGRFGEVMEKGDDGEEYNVLDDMSTFFLQNDSYCSGFESEIVHCGDHELVIISYGS
jgi:ABC-type cobalamin/Fe3+-siderophores transport system ATPase subunit